MSPGFHIRDLGSFSLSHRFKGAAAAVFGLLALVAAGCAPLFERQPATSAAPPPVDSVPAAPVSITPPAIKPAPPKPAPAKPAAPTMTLPELVGLSEEEVARLLGTADTLREEPPATIWGYRADTCALDLFFYMDMESRSFRALAYDVTTTDGAKGDPALNACLKRIMDRRR